MEAVYEWIRNITGYILFMTVLDNLLPGKKYGKYLKLFSGMVLILLIIQPLTGSIRLDDKIARYYEAFVFQYETDDLKQEILGMEDTRMNQIIAGYEAAVAEDVRQMAEAEGFGVVSCQVTIESNREAADFGTVRKTSLRVIPDGVAEVNQNQACGAVPVEPVKPVTVDLIAQDQVAGRAGDQGADPVADPAVDQAAEANREKGEEEQLGVGKLRRKIVSYYGLEESYVEIQIMESQR